MSDLVDDLGGQVSLARPVTRVVSIVPSLTESIAASHAHLLVGVTDWCTHPFGLEAQRIGGTKNPDVERIVALDPDVVVANEEENRPADITALRSRGLQVWVTAPRTVPQALHSLGTMLEALGIDRPGWLAAASDVWSVTWTGKRVRAVVPIWRRPWMVLGSATFAGDLLSRIGVDNVFGSDPVRYPKVEIGRLPEHDIVVLPDEPYAFSASDGPEAFAAPARLVSGRHLTWYGPSLVDARALLTHSIWG
jgi:ABC-type Fe3+-hydroxamate transport system substrate-binding protein